MAKNNLNPIAIIPGVMLFLTAIYSIVESMGIAVSYINWVKESEYGGDGDFVVENIPYIFSAFAAAIIAIQTIVKRRNKAIPIGFGIWILSEIFIVIFKEIFTPGRTFDFSGRDMARRYISITFVVEKALFIVVLTTLMISSISMLKSKNKAAKKWKHLIILCVGYFLVVLIDSIIIAQNLKYVSSVPSVVFRSVISGFNPFISESPVFEFIIKPILFSFWLCVAFIFLSIWLGNKKGTRTTNNYQQTIANSCVYPTNLFQQPAISESDPNYTEELKKLKELLDSGIITQEDFDAKKKQLLGL